MPIEKDLLAAALADLWAPALLKIKQEKFAADATLLSGMVGFAGIQMNLWPIWLQACEAAGCPIPEAAQAIAMKDVQNITEPWLCISLPYGGKVVLVHIQAPGLMQDRKVLGELTRPAFMQMMRTTVSYTHLRAHETRHDLV